ncbi:MAG: hypothetical protein WD750_05805 [Gammaproteobacteria bacterium]
MKYVTLTGIRRDGKRIPANTEVEMSPRQAEPLVNHKPRPVLRPVTAEDKKPEAGKTPTAAELIAEIAEMDDVERLQELTEDTRKTVSEAALERLSELQDGSGGE